MFKERFGIEIEFAGIARSKASRLVADYLGGTISEARDYYDMKVITAPDGRKWKVMYEGSLRCQTKRGGEIVSAGRDYSCELVSPILTYDEDRNTLQELVRILRKAGGFTNSSCGIHVHLDGADHDVRSIRNLINIVASKNDLLYKALEIKPERMRFCKKMAEHCPNGRFSFSFDGYGREQKMNNEVDNILAKLKKWTATKEDVTRLKEMAGLGDTKAALNYGICLFVGPLIDDVEGSVYRNMSKMVVD